jgi:hypothetical protein
MTHSAKLPAIVLDEIGARRYWLETPQPDAHRLRSGPDDFGDPASIGLMLKRRGKAIPQLGEYDFGIYAGHQGGKWIVIVKDLWTWAPVGYAEYESLDWLKRDWVLD